MPKQEPKFDKLSLITQHLVKRHDAAMREVVDADELKDRTAQLLLVLDLAVRRFQENKPAGETVDRLAGRLHKLRNESGPGVWAALIPLAQGHRVMDFLLQDPFTRWSFEKPRGYSGDATLLDIYYKHPSVEELVRSATPLGIEIYDYTSEAASSVAGRERRDLLAQYVDETAERVTDAEVLALACGHLREAEISHALASGQLKRWIGMDQDPASVATITQQWLGTNVDAREGTVKGLLRRSYELGKFDLVYASGLYDYLPRAVAIRLTQRSMELLKPNGCFLFANFTDEITTDGYMETFMDWPLILRSDSAMWDIINASVDRNDTEASVFYGRNRNVVYGIIRKNG